MKHLWIEMAFPFVISLLIFFTTRAHAMNNLPAVWMEDKNFSAKLQREKYFRFAPGVSTNSIICRAALPHELWRPIMWDFRNTEECTIVSQPYLIFWYCLPLWNRALIDKKMHYETAAGPICRMQWNRRYVSWFSITIHFPLHKIHSLNFLDHSQSKTHSAQ